jgi:hypothetical protein
MYTSNRRKSSLDVQKSVRSHPISAFFAEALVLRQTNDNKPLNMLSVVSTCPPSLFNFRPEEASCCFTAYFTPKDGNQPPKLKHGALTTVAKNFNTKPRTDGKIWKWSPFKSENPFTSAFCVTMTMQSKLVLY